jgi:hypothetical protein
MATKGWDAASDRDLLFHIISYNNIAMSKAAWDEIAEMFNDGRKGDAFRKRFATLKEDYSLAHPERSYPAKGENNNKSLPSI